MPIPIPVIVGALLVTSAGLTVKHIKDTKKVHPLEKALDERMDKMLNFMCIKTKGFTLNDKLYKFSNRFGTHCYEIPPESEDRIEHLQALVWGFCHLSWVHERNNLASFCYHEHIDMCKLAIQEANKLLEEIDSDDSFKVQKLILQIRTELNASVQQSILLPNNLF